MNYQLDIEKGQRFQFGANWTKFLQVLNDERILEADESLKNMLEIADLKGKTFLDIGSGSGLFSLAARRLGATVHSFDYDPQSVACTRELKRRYFPDDPNWKIEEGSILDESFIKSIGLFNYVYSWGVLHHTGQMWKALGNADGLVDEGGKLFVSIYNDQGLKSKMWRVIKRTYNRSPKYLRFLILYPLFLSYLTAVNIRDCLILKPFNTWRMYHRKRGMSLKHDVVDWVGGYPFEVAKPEEIFDFYRQRGYVLEKLITSGGKNGCNQFVFQRIKK